MVSTAWFKPAMTNENKETTSSTTYRRHRIAKVTSTDRLPPYNAGAM